ncbi:MAG: hypothetical protein WCA91_11155, partial [Candidatus Acidiferrales bacterium]
LWRPRWPLRSASPITLKQLAADFQSSMARVRETCSRYIGDKSFTFISVTRWRITASNSRNRFEDDFDKDHFGGIKTSKRQLIQNVQK